MSLQPYQQGHLDYYCGLYSIANALKLIDKKMRDEESIKLFRRLFCFLEKTGKLGSVAKTGIAPSELDLILNHVVSNRYCITITRPFFRKRKPSINQLINKIKEFLEEASGRAAIAGICREEYEFDHWSVIRRITKQEIHLFDSCSLKRIQKKKCTTSLSRIDKEYFIDPSEIFFLQKENTKKKGAKRKICTSQK